MLSANDAAASACATANRRFAAVRACARVAGSALPLRRLLRLALRLASLPLPGALAGLPRADVSAEATRGRAWGGECWGEAR